MTRTTATTHEGPAGAASVAGLLLAAGGGRRLGGRPKALLGHRGRPLVEHAARILAEGGCAPRYVVLGAASEEVRARARLPGCVLLDNPAWGEGMGSSLRAGLAALTPGDAPAVLVTLVDQPRVGAAAVARLLAAHRAGADLAAASYDGERGHPVLLARRHWAGVARAATGDRGARDYLREHAAELTLVECGDVADPGDIDTPDDLRLLG
ncbi:nucleotidyltransferase family protein [Streptomyces sp. HU2014]|uniref:4-diphosphocytidyl-2C-methyl-D-erythritol synthase n=1 Tax=Streptomyces albireticuli TaxID=1940 RepID=A0A1Z2KYF9_9ACTN|nr:MULTISPECIES: nucleotidyltransferase family protein [Streptomyces]ARZ67087.1 4-diphosphocytidyl-2C-methyl-D-erythritol synthase [Streptomyces albireticuli]UQI47143.1 nucleotidyltransferase family protein [Streptomyces sp. HU2014]